MKRAMLALLLGMVISGSMLHLGAYPAQAAGPADGTGPWVIPAEDLCIGDTHALLNEKSGKVHCFKD